MVRRYIDLYQPMVRRYSRAIYGVVNPVVICHHITADYPLPPEGIPVVMGGSNPAVIQYSGVVYLVGLTLYCLTKMSSYNVQPIYGCQTYRLN